MEATGADDAKIAAIAAHDAPFSMRERAWQGAAAIP